ncbi:Sulfotransferase 1C2 like protein [Argiope bruennichi]|uniref:Sulfotransferase 1C2 like protein n=1 Tax=Argiope bruennichi TaxID=94029 RepID=A0A8T0E9P8_ARGBR|nr:Sulfotransferase 1C2 like protein [Argiope bruennichi]
MESTDESQSSSELPVSQFVDGFQIPFMFPTEEFRSAKQYKPLPGDLFIVTYPKCGTTWAQQILLLIFRQGKPLESPKEFFLATPFMDEQNRLRTCHVRTASKHIYQFIWFPGLSRPSTSHAGTQDLAPTPTGAQNTLEELDEYFELFLAGNVDYGDYFDHLMGWYERRNDPNVLFMTYEEIQEGTEASILKMASFVDDEKYAEPLRKDRQLLNNVLKFSSFQYMKEAAQKRIEAVGSMTDDEIQNSDLPEGEKRRYFRIRQQVAERKERNPHTMDNIRKGIVGDWRNYFSEDQSRRMDEKFGAKAAETMPRPGALKTHLPFHLTPWSDEAKYIYITRNPKDCCVSYYHHMKNLPGHGFKGTFDEFFECFISGNIGYGDYFDNLLGWYEHRNDPNVLFMTYEEMKENPEAAILKMASFIDEEEYAKLLREDPRSCSAC